MHNLMLNDICNQILEIDKSIRFAGFVNYMGTMITAQYREALSVEKEKEQSLLTKDELELSAIESMLRMVTRKDMMSKLGKPIYSFTLYEKVKRATILLENSKNSDYPHGILRQQQRGRSLSGNHNFEWHLTIGVKLLEQCKQVPPDSIKSKVLMEETA